MNREQKPSIKLIKEKMIPVYAKPKKTLSWNKDVRNREIISESSIVSTPEESKPIKSTFKKNKVMPYSSTLNERKIEPKTTDRVKSASNHLQLFLEEFNKALEQEQQRKRDEESRQSLVEQAQQKLNKDKRDADVQLMKVMGEQISKAFMESYDGKEPPPVSTSELVSKTVSSMRKFTPKQDDDSGVSEQVKRELDAIRKATNDFKKVVTQLQVSGSSHGGGEVNLRFLDDVDTSNLADGATLVWDASKGKFVFGTAVVTPPGLFTQTNYNGPTSVINLPKVATTNSTFVYVNGVQLIPANGYSISSTLLTLADSVGPTDVVTVKVPSMTLQPGDSFQYIDVQNVGDGTQNTFTISPASTSNDSIVSINGVIQLPGTAYTIAGTTLTFTTPVSNGDIIDVRIPKLTSSTNTFSKVFDQFTGDGVQASYVLSTNTTTDEAFVAVNGITQIGGNSYNVSGTVLTFSTPVFAGDIIDVRIPKLT